MMPMQLTLCSNEENSETRIEEKTCVHLHHSEWKQGVGDVLPCVHLSLG